MKTATLNYLNHHIRLELPDPEDNNTVYVEIHRQSGTYDPNEYNSYLSDFQFSAESPNPNDWVIEAMKYAIADLAGYGVKFHEITPPVVTTVVTTDDCLDDIPF